MPELIEFLSFVFIALVAFTPPPAKKSFKNH